jgi:acetoin utilization deacetylase AcuC-like enzyme
VTGIYTDQRCLEHYVPGHPESPERMRAALRGLQEAGLPLHWPAVRPADLMDLELIHPSGHIRRVAQLAEAGGGWVDPDTYVVPASFDAARYAAGAALQAVGDVLAGHEDNAFAVVRPPGHHATADRSMGFCLFNSVAVAAQWAIAQGGAQRVAILDVDVHHGNGTEAIFYDRPDVFYYSTHQYPFYPGTGRIEDVGMNDGTGTTLNVPLMAGCGDETFEDVTQLLLAPAVRRFRPDLVLVSLGFDAHWADPLAQMRLSTAGYAEILGQIRALAAELCGGRLVILLEGGYDTGVVQEGSRLVGHLLCGAPLPAPGVGAAPPAPEPSGAAARIEAVRQAHALSEV